MISRNFPMRCHHSASLPSCIITSQLQIFIENGTRISLFLTFALKILMETWTIAIKRAN